jgi:hypothetical protein
VDQQGPLPDSLLRDLIEHFSKIGLGNEAAQADLLAHERARLGSRWAIKPSRLGWKLQIGAESPRKLLAIPRLSLIKRCT